jgi:DHA3 family macrolide efflux protein-like MFS transporter
MPAKLPTQTRNIFLASSVSIAGNQANVLAVSYFIKQATNSPAFLSSILSAAAFTVLLSAPLASRIRTLQARRRVLVGLNVIASLLCLSMAAATYRPSEQSMFLLGFGFIGLAAVGNMQTPVLRTLVTDLVPKENLLAINGRLHASGNFASLIGQVLCASIYQLIKIPGLLLLDALSYIAASVSYASIRSSAKAESSDPPKAERFAFVSFRILRSHPALLRDLVLLASISLLISPLVVFLPFVASGGAHELGIYYASISLGSLIGGLLIPRFAQVSFASLILLLGASRIGLGLCPGIVLKSLSIFGESLFASLISIKAITKIQVHTPQHLQAQMMSLVAMIMVPLVPLGFLLGGFLLEQWAEAQGELIAGLGLAIAMIGLMEAFFAMKNSPMNKKRRTVP